MVLLHFLKAGNEHSIHSPFLYDLYCSCFKSHERFYAFEEIESIRNELSSNDKLIDDHDFGQPSLSLPRKRRAIKNIHHSSSISKRNGELLFKIVNKLKPSRIIELGTCLGISTLYLAKADSQAQIISLEGNSERAIVAKHLFKRSKTKNIEVREGDIDTILPNLLNQVDAIDLVYIDANHSYEGTTKYFELISKHANNNTVLIFDDIFWSRDMTRAWNKIRRNTRITLSFNTNQLGFVFFRKEQRKEHFYLRV